ncbi:MAG: cellulose synthase [Alphaproteobacteria bacterium]|nr:MAG: cellulose synthase [Alphaproteobacteria bacterium]
MLAAGELAGAARDFKAALAVRPNDADALGGMGIVQLRQKRFSEASASLAQASARGERAQWAEALASARFFASLETAQRLRDTGQIDEAQKIAEDLSSSTSPSRGPALELLATIYESKGHFAEAAELYRTAATLNGSAQPEAGARLARQATRAMALQAAGANNDSEAERLFRRGLMEAPGDPWIRYDYARFLDQRGRRMEVLAIIASLTQLPGDEAIYVAALLNSQIGQDATAAQLMGRIRPDQQTVAMRGFAEGLKVDAAIARALMLARRGESAAAFALIRQTAQAPGLTMTKQGDIAGALYELGDAPSARALAEQALRAGSTNPADFESVIRVLAQSGDEATARQAVEQAATAGGTLGGDQRLLARLNAIVVVAQADRLRIAGEFAAAFDLLQAAWLAAPGDEAILGALARLYQSGGLLPQAVQTFRLVLAKSPEDKGALIGLVDTAGSTGDYALARSALARAVKIDANDYTIYLAAARMEQGRGDEGAASRHLKHARDLYTRRTQSVGGGFGSGNPFAASTNSNGSDVAAAINPFDLSAAPAGRRTTLAAATMSTDFDQGAGSMSTLPGGREPRPGDRDRPQSRSSDPVLQTIDQDLAALASADETRADLKTEYRQRSGETGLSNLKAISGQAELSTGLAGGRIAAVAVATTLDAGRPTGSGLARFGRNATPEAIGIVAALPSVLVPAETQHASGVALSAAYTNGIVKADAGTTPLGFKRTGIVGGVTLTPRLSPTLSARLWAERRAVADSVISHAGTIDPVSGDFWGAVRRAGGGASLSYDVGGTGVYADGSYYRYTGTAVRSNSSIQANVGGYLRVLKNSASSLSIGINANYQQFDNQQNYFTFGHGGYFSPQNFLSISFPAHYVFLKDGFEIDLNAAPGYQSYSQAAAAVYPTDAAAQAALEALKALNTDVRSTYDSISETGFGLSASATLYYAVNPRLKIGSEANYNSFGAYKEFRGSVGIKQVIGDR